MAEAISIRGLRVVYGETVALDGVDLELSAGQVHGLVGMNGSGKSTLFKAIMELASPESGVVRVYGGSPGEARKAGRIAYTPQNELIDWAFPITVEEVVLMGRYGRMGPLRRTSTADRHSAARALERVGLEAVSGRQIGALSGGQRKRVFIARSLAQDADLLLLDEPFAGVDKRSEAMIAALLRELADEGRTVLISTHDLVAVPELCDDVCLLNRRVIFHGPVGEALEPSQIAAAFGGFVPFEAVPK